jgi:hypothetical protein
MHNHYHAALRVDLTTAHPIAESVCVLLYQTLAPCLAPLLAMACKRWVQQSVLVAHHEPTFVVLELTPNMNHGQLLSYA